METESSVSGHLELWSRAAWTFGGFVVAAVLANVYIAAGAILATASEVGASRTAGMVINGAALVLMMVLYAGSLWGLASLFGSRRQIPSFAWVGFALFPTLWLVIIAVAPPGMLAVTPTLVSAVGAVPAWLAIRRERKSSDAH